MKTYNKLIRDRIPEIIEEAGKTHKTKTLDSESFQKALKQKLIEEAEELTEAKTQPEIIDELADIEELLHYIYEAHNVDIETVKQRRKEKAESNGAFDKKLFLVHVDDK